MLHPKASNSVDRGEPAEAHLARVLAHFLDRDPVRDAGWLHTEAVTVLVMVAADSSEIQVARYIGQLEVELGRPLSPGPTRRGIAIALWHIGKAALVRDRALRLLEERGPAATTPVRLSEWLRGRLLRDEPRGPEG